MKFVIDRCLGKSTVESLRALGANAVYLDELFAQDTEDAVWIPSVSAQGYTIVTRDERMLRVAEEREALSVRRAVVSSFEPN